MNLIEKDIKSLINDDPKVKGDNFLMDFMDSLLKYVDSKNFKADEDFEDLILLLAVTLAINQETFTKTLQRMVITQFLNVTDISEEAMNALHYGDSKVRLEIVIEKNKAGLVH